MSIDFATMFETAPMTVDERKTLALICQFYDLTKQQAADAFNNIFHRVPLPPGQTETPAEFAQMLYEWYIPRVTLDEYCLLRSCKSDRDDIERLLQVIFERGGIDKEPVEGKGTCKLIPHVQHIAID